jgi:hypothetical protein
MRRTTLLALIALLITLGCQGHGEVVEVIAESDADMVPRVVRAAAPAGVVDDEGPEPESQLSEAELTRMERTFEYDPANPPEPQVIRVRRRRVQAMLSPFQHAQIRMAAWNLETNQTTEAELTEALVIGLHRLAGSEVEFGNERDMHGIWQVVDNVRRTAHCLNSRMPSRAIPISQCRTSTGIVSVGPREDVPDAHETRLSSMRRLSSRVMGMRRTERRRLQWVRHITPACEEPENWPERRTWSRTRPRCERHAVLMRQIVTGEVSIRVTGRATPAGWGGRCDNPVGACDDPGACRRGHRRIENTGTANAFWCVPGRRGCGPWIEYRGVLYSDELCARMGISPNRLPRRSARGRVVVVEDLDDLPEAAGETEEDPDTPEAERAGEDPLAAP